MGKYLVVHPVGPDMNLDEAKPIGQIVKANCSTDAYWVRSWYTPEDGNFYCEWDAKDADAVRAALERAAAAGVQMPAKGIYPIVGAMNGEDFR